MELENSKLWDFLAAKAELMHYACYTTTYA